MILYHKMYLIMIAIEIKIGNQIKVFVNPAEYVFEPGDHHCYVINDKQPDSDKINSLDLQRNNAENFFIMDYINKKEM